MQIIEREAPLALRGELNMNTIFWRDVQNHDPSNYDALLNMMMREIINEELIDDHNKASKGLLPKLIVPIEIKFIFKNKEDKVATCKARRTRYKWQ